MSLLWLNPSETFTDLSPPHAHFYSESNLLLFYLLPSSSLPGLFNSLALLTSPTPLPQQFTLGYHQSRYTYTSSQDILQVDSQFDTLSIPYDAIWLDLDHTLNRKYFTFGAHYSPSKQFLSVLMDKGRNAVALVDPHVKKERAYFVYDMGCSGAFKESLFVKLRDGADFEGECWPGRSVWFDFLRKNVREEYSRLYSYDVYKGSSPNLYIWYVCVCFF